MDHLKATAEFLRKQLAEIEEKIRTFDDKPPVSIEKVPTKIVMSIEEMRDKIAEMDPDPKWKAFVETPYGVVDNIVSILDDCYYPFVDSIQEMNCDKKAVSIIGKPKSKEWQEFQLRVIRKLLDPKDYDEDYDFEDTANGCDEVAWDEGVAVIEEIVKST
jgi:hypothetical protein